MYAAPFALLATLVGSSYAQLSADFVASLRNAGTAPERLALLKDEDVSLSLPPQAVMILTSFPSFYLTSIMPPQASSWAQGVTL